MDALRFLARQENVKPNQRTINTFHNVFLKDVELAGKLYEAGLIGGYVLPSMQIAGWHQPGHRILACPCS